MNETAAMAMKQVILATAAKCGIEMIFQPEKNRYISKTALAIETQVFTGNQPRNTGTNPVTKE
jgi:hypothetical protein